jgi:ubiquinone/menaquinone biosynthesis C-methylase UbiE
MFIRVREPKNQLELEGLYAFRYRVYVGDDRCGTYNLDHERGLLSDQLDESAFHLIAVDDEGNIVGCLRTNARCETAFPDYLNSWLKFPELDGALNTDAYGYTSLLMVEPSMRGRTVASLLALKMYHRGTRDANLQFDVCCCELNLVHVYYQLGYRPYAPPFRVEGAGMRVPLVLCGYDKEYLHKVDSPLRNIFPKDADDGGESARFLQQRFELFAEPAFSPLPERVAWAILAAGPGNEGRDEQQKTSLFTGLDGEQLGRVLGTVTRVWFSPGDRIYERGESETSSGIVVSGRVGVHLAPGPDPHFASVLGPGDVFGEVAGLGSGIRSAYLTALERTEAMLIAPDFVDRVRKKDAETAFLLARNLNAVLADRLTNANDLLASIFSGEAVEEVSYDIKHKGDDELARLEQQATVMANRELGILRQLGLAEDQSVCDVGCGPGLLSAAIAGNVPGTKVTGVDPQAALLARAAATCPDSLSNRCSFVQGDGTSIPLASSSQDFVFCRFVLQHLKKPTDMVREMCRITAPGGIVCAIDVDDGGIILHPEPEGYYEVQAQIEKVKSRVGGNRKVGRRLGSVLSNVDLDAVKINILPVTSNELGVRTLLHLAFGFRKRLLQESGVFTREAARFFSELERLPDTPGALVVVPIFLATGHKKSIES